MEVYALTCFHGRHYNTEMVMRCFMEQDYEGDTTLILYNNSKVKQELDYQALKDLKPNMNIKLINNYIDEETGQEYTNTGAIFRDAMKHIPSLSIVTFMDSDDIFLPNHISEGIRGLKEAYFKITKYIAYKPYYSYFIDGNNKVSLEHNNMEPSIFCKSWWIKEKGFHMAPSSYHQKWKDILDREEKIYVPKYGTPTFVYNWKKDHNTHKISGLGDTLDNFKAHREYECNNGDGVLTPASWLDYQEFIQMINQYR